METFPIFQCKYIPFHLENLKVLYVSKTFTLSTAFIHDFESRQSYVETLPNISISVQTMQFHCSLFNLLLCKHVRSTRNGPTIRWPLFSCLQSSQLHLFSILLQGQSSKILNHQVANNANVYSQTFHIIQSHIDSFNILNPPISSIDK